MDTLGHESLSIMQRCLLCGSYFKVIGMLGAVQ